MLNFKIDPSPFVENYKKKIKTFNGGEIFLLSEISEKEQERWQEKITCAICFINDYFSKESISLPKTAYKIYLSPLRAEVKKLLFDQTKNKELMKSNIDFLAIKGQLVSSVIVKYPMEVAQYVKIIMQIKGYILPIGIETKLPLWYTEGLSYYLQGKKDNIDFFDLARASDFLPPFVLKEMNFSIEQSIINFRGNQSYASQNYSTESIACASVIQFLIEKEKISFKDLWRLVESKNILDFYNSLEVLCQKKIFFLLNDYLYYLDQPYFSDKQTSWRMPDFDHLNQKINPLRKKVFKVMNVI